jgi:hypothetical protein
MLFTKATIALHNYLRTEEGTTYCPAGFVDGEDGSGNINHGTWREERSGGLRFCYWKKLCNLPYLSWMTSVYSIANRYSRSATEIRDSYASYLCSTAGEVSWQYRHVQRT